MDLRWTHRNPLPGPRWYQSVTGDGAGTFWLVGIPSLNTPSPIAWSRDGGRTWTEEPFLVRKGLARVRCAPNGDPYCAGNFGTLVARKKGAWKRLRPGFKGALYGLCFDGPRRVWLSGDQGFLALSEDEGAHWSTLDTGTTSMLLDLACDGAGHWVAVGLDRVILRSDDGQRWTVVRGPEPKRDGRYPRRLVSVRAYGTGRFVAVGDELCTRSEDGGRTWTDGAVADEENLSGVSIGPRGAWFAAGINTVRRSDDQGASWVCEHELTDGTHRWIYGLHVEPDGSGVGVGPHNTGWVREVP